MQSPNIKTTGRLFEGSKDTTFFARFSKRGKLSARIFKFSPFRQAVDGQSGQIQPMSPTGNESAHREHDPREMLLRSGGKLFQDVGYVQASIQRIASAVNAPKGTFYNYFKSKEDLASRLVDRQFEALEESLSQATRRSASDQLKEHCHFLAIEPPAIEVAPLQLLATLAAEAPAIPAALTQRIARGTDVWTTRVSDLISRVQIENGTTPARDESQKLASLLVTCWYGAIVRRKVEPSLKPMDEFLPFFVRGGFP